MREYLSDIRKEKGLTQKEVSTQLGVSESYYNLIENGERQKDMSISTIYTLSKISKVPLKSLIDKEIKFFKGDI